MKYKKHPVDNGVYTFSVSHKNKYHHGDLISFMYFCTIVRLLCQFNSF